MIMKKMLKTMLLGLLFVSPIMIGMQQGAAPISVPAAAPTPRIDPAATAELEKFIQKGEFTTDDWTAMVRLLDNGADINVKDNYGWTALMWAVNNNKGMVELLLSRGATIDVKDRHGRTALDLAQKHKNQSVIKLLQDALHVLQQRMPQGALLPAPISAPTAAPTPRIDPAATAELEEFIQKRELTTDDWTAMVRELLAHDADINVQNIYGNTVLMGAVDNNNIDMIQLLLARGANVNVKNNDGRTALIFARHNNNQAVIKLLQDALQQRMSQGALLPAPLAVIDDISEEVLKEQFNKIKQYPSSTVVDFLHDELSRLMIFDQSIIVTNPLWPDLDSQIVQAIPLKKFINGILDRFINIESDNQTAAVQALAFYALYYMRSLNSEFKIKITQNNIHKLFYIAYLIALDMFSDYQYFKFIIPSDFIQSYPVLCEFSKNVVEDRMRFCQLFWSRDIPLNIPLRNIITIAQEFEQYNIARPLEVQAAQLANQAAMKAAMKAAEQVVDQARQAYLAVEKTSQEITPAQEALRRVSEQVEREYQDFVRK